MMTLHVDSPNHSRVALHPKESKITIITIMKDEQFDYLTFLIMIVLRYNVKTLNIISNAHILNTLVADIYKEPTLYKPAVLG
jgi:hypothetical protein